MSEKYRYRVFTIDLNNAVDLEFEMEGGFIYVKDATDLSTWVNVQPDTRDNDKIRLVKQHGFIVDSHFKRFYVTADAQTGKTVTLLVTDSYDHVRTIEQAEGSEVSISEAVVETAQTPALYNVTLSSANTEYSQALPSGCKKFLVKPRGGSLKINFTGNLTTDPYINLEDGQAWNEDNVSLTGKTLRFESPTAGTVVEILAWT